MPHKMSTGGAQNKSPTGEVPATPLSVEEPPSHNGKQSKAQRTGCLVPGVGDAVGRFLLPLPSVPAGVSVAHASADSVVSNRFHSSHRANPTLGKGESSAGMSRATQRASLPLGKDEKEQNSHAGPERPKFAEPNKRDGDENSNAGEESRSEQVHEGTQEGIVMETISYQNAFAKAKQRENAGKFQAQDIASLTATDDTLPDAKMGLLLPCRMVTIKDTRRMGNPVSTVRSGGKWPDDDRSTQFREHSKAKDPDDGAGMATKVPFGQGPTFLVVTRYSVSSRPLCTLCT